MVIKTICICSSIQNLDLIKKTTQDLEHIGMRGLFPNIEFQPSGAKLSSTEMKKLQQDHFKAIDSSDAIYVINPDGYIGTMVTAEIGYAYGQGRPIFFSEESGSLELDALSSGVISLDHMEELKLKTH